MNLIQIEIISKATLYNNASDINTKYRKESHAYVLCKKKKKK